MTDETSDVDFSLQEKFKKRKEENSMRALREQVDSLEQHKTELTIAGHRLRECSNQLEVLQKNLEIYAKKTKDVLVQLEKIENTLKKERGDDS